MKNNLFVGLTFYRFFGDIYFQSNSGKVTLAESKTSYRLNVLNIANYTIEMKEVAYSAEILGAYEEGNGKYILYPFSDLEDLETITYLIFKNKIKLNFDFLSN